MSLLLNIIQIPAIWRVFLTKGEDQEKAKKESLEMLRAIEDHAGLERKKYFGGDRIGIVDIAFGMMVLWFGVIEEVLGVKLFEAQAFPHLHAWTMHFKELPVIKENLPDRDYLMAGFIDYRDNVLAYQ